MKSELILKDVTDPILRENFARIQDYFTQNLLLNSGFKLIEVDVANQNLKYPVAHGLSYVPTDIIPLAAEGDFNFYFRGDLTDRNNVYVAAHGPVRLRFLVGKINQTGRRLLRELDLPFVAPMTGSSGGGGEGQTLTAVYPLLYNQGTSSLSLDKKDLYDGGNF